MPIVRVDSAQALVDEGKVRYVGLANCTAEQLCRAHAVHPISAIECEWSLCARHNEVCRRLTFLPCKPPACSRDGLVLKPRHLKRHACSVCSTRAAHRSSCFLQCHWQMRRQMLRLTMIARIMR